MFDYLQKFSKLPKNIRDAVSSKEVMASISRIEQKYSIELAPLVMKIMIKNISMQELLKYFLVMFGLDMERAENLLDEMKKDVFFNVLDYLNVDNDSIQDKNNNKEKLITEKMPLTANSKTNLFFFSEDDEEIKKINKKINTEFKSKVYNIEIDKKIEEVISKAKINFGSSELLGRFKKIIRTYLLGVRDKIEANQSFKKPILEGGLDFDDQSTSDIMKIMKEVKNNQHIKQTEKPRKIILPEDRDFSMNRKKIIGGVGGEYNLKKSLDQYKNKKNIKKINQSNKVIDKKNLKQLAPPPPVILDHSKQKLQKNSIKKVNTALPKKKAKTTFNFIDKTKIKATRVIDTGWRKRMDDIKYSAKTMSLTEELRFMDLVSFRRLAKTVDGIKNKIINKVELLEEHKYSKRLEGIKAWRQSPVNKLYLNIGQESIDAKGSIEATINKRNTNGKDCLTNDEFQMIMDLNKILRF